MEKELSHEHSVSANAHPSLALIKYWGKHPCKARNVASTTNIAVTLSTLTSTVTVSPSSTAHDEFILNNESQNLSGIELIKQAIFTQARVHGYKIPQSLLDSTVCVTAENNFITSAGLASSSSGYAALTCALASYYGLTFSPQTLSSIAREGSGSACRSVFGGFTIWREKSFYAEQIAPKEYWSEFRVIVVASSAEKKTVSSREGMITTAATSPYYAEWCTYNERLAEDALQAIMHKDIQKLGELAIKSYSAMHAAAIAAYPPIRYWNARSMEILNLISQLRNKGVPVWETMDAGPQIMLVTLRAHVDTILSDLAEYERATCTHDAQKLWICVCEAGEGSAVKP